MFCKYNKYINRYFLYMSLRVGDDNNENNNFYWTGNIQVAQADGSLTYTINKSPPIINMKIKKIQVKLNAFFYKE